MARSVPMAAFLLVVLCGCGGEVSTRTLAESSVKGTPEEQEKATLELTRRGQVVIPDLRKVVAESTSPRARAAAIQALGAFNDFESMPAILAALDDSDSLVRGRAGVAAANLIGADYHFRADDPAPKRRAIIGAIAKSYEKMLKRPDPKN